MEFEISEFIHFSLFAISVNFPNLLVTGICVPILKDQALAGNGSMLIVIFLRKLEKCHSYKS